MIIKTFRAESSSAALKRVREEMGGDAVVLKSRQVFDSRRQPLFEVTACIERPSVAQSSRLLSDVIAPGMRQAAGVVNGIVDDSTELVSGVKASSENRRQRNADAEQKVKRLSVMDAKNEINDETIKYTRIQRQLSEADFPAGFVTSFTNGLVDNNVVEPHLISSVHRKLVNRFADAMLPDFKIKCGQMVVFFGPSGAGKSSAMGKLAASLVARDHLKVKLASFDNVRLAAHDEIAAYAEILGAELLDVQSDDNDTFKDKKTVTLIDTPAITGNGASLDSLKTILTRIKPDIRFAVISALTRSRDIVLLGEKLRELNPTHLIVTMCDLTRSYGAVLTAVKACEAKIAFISNAPGGAGWLQVPDPDKFTRAILNAEVAGE